MSKTNPSDDLERIRQVRNGQDKPTETADIFTCPIDGCSRTVIGSPEHLRSHAAQAEDDAHRFMTLNADLELEFDEETYHSAWGPGQRSDRSGPRVRNGGTYQNK